MVRRKRIKPTQSEWYCGRLSKNFTATMNAYAINGNWLCPCGNFIKDTPHLHRFIRQSEKTPDEEITEEVIFTKEDLNDYKVYYWVNNEEKTKMFKAYNEDNLKKKLDKSFIGLLSYAAFKIMKDEPKNMQVLVNTI